MAIKTKRIFSSKVIFGICSRVLIKMLVHIGITNRAAIKIVTAQARICLTI